MSGRVYVMTCKATREELDEIQTLAREHGVSVSALLREGAKARARDLEKARHMRRAKSRKEAAKSNG